MRPVMALFRKMTPMRKLFYFLLVAGFVTAGLYFYPTARTAAGASAQKGVFKRSPQQPLLDGLILLRAKELVEAPVVDGFQWPCGAPNGAMFYDAQPFGAMNPKRHGYHTGKDLNGIGGQNTDLGLPVYAAARGLVVYSGEPSPEWGNVVVLAHKMPDGTIMQTLYAHLQDREARVGQHVCRGQKIGSIGTAGGRYAAHLHFEAIPSLCIEAGMPGYHPRGVMNRIDPAELIRQHPAPPIPDPYLEIRRLRFREAAQQQQTGSSS